MDIEKFRQQAEDQKKGNKKFLQKLKKQNSRELDERFHDFHAQAFDEIDCLECANCCKTTSPIFIDKDIERLSKHFRIRPSEFIEKHLHLDNENDYVLNVAPCPFLGSDNYCSVYENRPRACREYPHTDRRKMHQLLDLTFKNTLVCPAVLEIVNRLKAVY
jgi:Fe-S-cluster containining protein